MTLSWYDTLCTDRDYPYTIPPDAVNINFIEKTIYHFEDRHSIYMCEHFQAIPIFFRSSAPIYS